MFRRYVGLYALLFLFSGCAVQLPTQDPANLEKFRSGNVAVRVQAPEKNIIYNESLYRVLWIEYKDRTVSYDGAWEIEQDLDDEFVKGLASLGIRAKVLSRSESLKSYEKEVAAEYIKAPRQGLEPLVQKMSGPQYHFYKSLPNLNTFGALRQELLGSDYDYLMEVYVPSLSGAAPGYGMVTVGANLVYSIIDLKTAKVIWVSPAGTAELYQLGGDLNKLEENNLKLLKEGVISGLRKTFEKKGFKISLGFPAE